MVHDLVFTLSVLGATMRHMGQQQKPCRVCSYDSCMMHSRIARVTDKERLFCDSQLSGDIYLLINFRRSFSVQIRFKICIKFDAILIVSIFVNFGLHKEEKNRIPGTGEPARQAGASYSRACSHNEVISVFSFFQNYRVT